MEQIIPLKAWAILAAAPAILGWLFGEMRGAARARTEMELDHPRNLPADQHSSQAPSACDDSRAPVPEAHAGRGTRLIAVEALPTVVRAGDRSVDRDPSSQLSSAPIGGDHPVGPTSLAELHSETAKLRSEKSIWLAHVAESLRTDTHPPLYPAEPTAHGDAPNHQRAPELRAYQASGDHRGRRSGV